jgi:hypothetical protein
MRFAMLCTLACAACSSTGDALVVVTVSSAGGDIQNVQKLHASATASGHTKAFDVSFGNGMLFNIPPTHDFGVEIPAAYAGAFDITLDALAANGDTLASGMNSTTTSAGKETMLEVKLGNGLPGDLGGDGGGDANIDMVCVPLKCDQAGYGCGTLTTCGVDVDCGPCVLSSVHPSIANTGDTIILEGSFNPNVTVIFPGGTSATPTLLGTHRATVTVPATATAGLMGLSVGGTVGILRQPFRRANFKMALHDFHQTYEQTDAARAMSITAQEHTNAGAALAGQMVEVFGGLGYSGASPTPIPTVEMADVNGDGTVGLFNQDSRQLVTARSGFSTYSTPAAIFLIGGTDGGSAIFTSVEKASIHGDGSGTDTWGTVSGVTLNLARYYAGTAVIGDYLYVFGGATAGPIPGVNPNATKTIERAPIDSVDGSLGPFEMVTVQTNHPRVGAMPFVAKDKVYLIGGFDGTGFLTTIEEAPINGDGSLGTFSHSVNTSLQLDRALGGIVQLGGQVYVLGGASTNNGTTSTTPVNSAEKAGINSDGTLGAFASAGISLAQPRSSQPLLIGNYVYFFHSAGGSGPSGLAERSSIVDITAGLAPFADSGKMLAQAKFGMASVVVGKYLYLFGGDAGLGTGGLQKDAAKAIINDDGTLGPVTPSGALLNTPRNNSGVVAFGRDIHVCGGIVPGGPPPVFDNTCEHFTANLDGSLTLQPSPTAIAMPTKRAKFQMVAANGFLYAVGGDAGGGSCDRIALQGGRPVGNTMAVCPAQSYDVIANGRSHALIGTTDYLFGGIINDVQPTADVSQSSTDLLTFIGSGSKLADVIYDGISFSDGARVLLAGGVNSNMDMGLGSVSSELQGAPVILNSGNFQVQPFIAAGNLSTARRLPSGVMTHSYIYVIGGSGGLKGADMPLASIETAAIQ